MYSNLNNINVNVDMKNKTFKLKITSLMKNEINEEYSFLKNNNYKVNCKCSNNDTHNMLNIQNINKNNYNKDKVCFHQLLFILKMETKYLN